MSKTPPLAFDPIERAGQLWGQHIGDAKGMRVVTSVMRVHQLLLTQIDSALRPFGLTFSRYEVLVLLSFSRSGRLPLSKIGERLQVHPTSVTNSIDRLEKAGLVARQIDPNDRRRTLAELTETGRQQMAAATAALQSAQFFLADLSAEAADELFVGLREIRAASGDFRQEGPEGD